MASEVRRASVFVVQHGFSSCDNLIFASSQVRAPQFIRSGSFAIPRAPHFHQPSPTRQSKREWRPCVPALRRRMPPMSPRVSAPGDGLGGCMDLVEHVLEGDRKLPVPPPNVLDRAFKQRSDPHALDLALVFDCNGDEAGRQPVRHEAGEHLPGASRLPAQDGFHGLALIRRGPFVDQHHLGPAARDHELLALEGDDGPQPVQGRIPVLAGVEAQRPIADAALVGAALTEVCVTRADNLAVAALEQQPPGPPVGGVRRRRAGRGCAIGSRPRARHGVTSDRLQLAG